MRADELSPTAAPTVAMGEGGWDAGYRQGFLDGHAAAAVTERLSLEVMEGLLQQLVKEKIQLVGEVRLLGERLADHDAAFDAHLKAEMENLHRRAASAEVELASLRQNLASLDDSLVQRSRQYVTQAWLYNSCRVFMGATRKVLESLLGQESQVSEQVRSLFGRLYTEQVKQSLEKGMIKTAPEACPEFAAAMPATRKFILELLRAQRSK